MAEQCLGTDTGTRRAPGCWDHWECLERGQGRPLDQQVLTLSLCPGWPEPLVRNGDPPSSLREALGGYTRICRSHGQMRGPSLAPCRSHKADVATLTPTLFWEGLGRLGRAFGATGTERGAHSSAQLVFTGGLTGVGGSGSAAGAGATGGAGGRAGPAVPAVPEPMVTEVSTVTALPTVTVAPAGPPPQPPPHRSLPDLLLRTAPSL